MVDVVKVDALPWEKAAAPVNSVTQVDKLPWVNPTGAKVTRQKAGVFTGKEYEPGGMANPKNKALFENTGEPFTVFGVPVLDMRKQITSNAEGEKRTQFVPQAKDVNTVDPAVAEDFKAENPDMPPEFTDSLLKNVGSKNNFMPTAETERMVGGAALNTIKSTIDFGLYMLESADKLTGPQLDGNEMDINGSVVNNKVDPETEIAALRQKFNEEFPTMPAASNIEKIVQELMPVVIGYVGGREAGKEALTKGDKYVKLLADFYAKAKKADSATARAKTELLTKALVTEVMGNVGASVAAPEDAESISQQLNIVPDDIGGDTYAASKLGQFVDNNAFSLAITGLGKLAGVTVGAITSRFKSGVNQVDMANNFMRILDDEINEKTPVEELGRRIQILGDVLAKNKDFNFAINGNDMSVAMDSTSAIMLGAKDYVREVYKRDEMSLPPEVFEQFVTDKAQGIVERIVYLKQGLKANPVVAQSDGNVLAGFSGALGKVAKDQATGPLPSNRGTQEEVVAKAKNFFGQPVADALNTPKPNDLATLAATAARDDEMSKNTLIQMFEDARANNMLGSNATERAQLEKLTGEDLYNNYIKDKTVVDDAFNAVPNVPVDATELALKIQESGDIQGAMTAMGLSPKEPGLVQPVGDVVKDAKGSIVEDPLEELTKAIEKGGFNDLKTLVQKVRPMLAKQKAQVWDSSSRLNKDTAQLDNIIAYIDELATSGGPEFDAAMDTYKRFADKWLNTQPLRDFTSAADEVRSVTTTGADGLPIETFTKGGPEMRSAGMQAFTNSKEAFTDEQMIKFLEALRDPAGKNSKAITQALVAQAINQLAAKNPSGVIKTVDIIGAVQPLLRTLETSGDTESVKIFKDAAQQLQMAEANIGASASKDEIARNTYELLQAKARTSAAYEFVFPNASPVRVVSDEAASNAFKQLFDGPQAIDKIGELISKAEQSNNQLAVDGLRSELVKWLSTKIFTKKTVGFEGIEAVRDASGAQLISILEDQGNPVIPMLKTAFKTDPQTGKALVQVMQMMNSFINGRATKANPFGSNTVIDSQLERSVNMMITLIFGPLSRPGTQAKTLASLALDGNKKNMQEAANKLMSRIATDPQFLKESIDLLNADKSGTSWLAQYGKALGVATNAMTKGTSAALQPTIEQQTEEAIPMNKGMQ